MILKNDKKSEEDLICRFKIDMRNLTNFDSRTWKSQKTYTLMRCFWPKYIMFGLKKYRGVMFRETRVWCKIRRKSDLWFGKWHEESDKFSSEHSEVSKLGLSLGPFIQSRKCMSLKLTGGNYRLRQWRMMQNLKGIDLPVQNWHEEFNKFSPEHSKISKICTLMGWFWPKYMFELRKYWEVMFGGTQDWCKVWSETD